MVHRNSLTVRILAMVIITSAVICSLITAIGSVLIYTITEKSLKSEIETAAHTFVNSYDNKYHGEYYIENETLMKGDTPLNQEEFLVDASLIYFSTDIDFTIIWDGTRMLTTVKNPDGSYANGTKCDSEVYEHIKKNGIECFFKSVNVNDENA